MIEEIVQLVPAFVLVVFRLAGMMLFAPLFGSTRIPRRVKVLLVVILALGITPGVAPVDLPTDAWGLALGIGSELIFGLALGMVLSFVFIAAQWAGEMIGQQMGLNLSEVFDPQFGQQGSLIGDMYFMLTLVVFLLIDGHHAMLRGVFGSFEALPLMAVGMSAGLLEVLIGLFQGATGLALQLAAPVLVTMLIVDLSLGFISKTMPQINVLTAGLPLRAIVGMVLLILGVVLTVQVLEQSLMEAMRGVVQMWKGLLVVSR
jgi:flagellar biosynthesis protein FliR